MLSSIVHISTNIMVLCTNFQQEKRCIPNRFTIHQLQIFKFIYTIQQTKIHLRHYLCIGLSELRDLFLCVSVLNSDFSALFSETSSLFRKTSGLFSEKTSLFGQNFKSFLSLSGKKNTPDSLAAIGGNH